MNWKWDCAFVVSTKFAFIQIGCRLRSPAIFLLIGIGRPGFSPPELGLTID
jgi:hypothetical protein